MASSESLSFMKYLFFTIAFILSFCVLNIKQVEIFGFGLFFGINILFCILIGKDLTDGSISPAGKDTEWMLRYGTLLVSIVFSLVSTIMMIMTLTNLHGKFSDANSEIQWSNHDRKKLDDIKIIFVTITTFIGVTALYVYNTKTDIRKTVYAIFDSILNGSGKNSIIDTILNGSIGDWILTTFPIVSIALGAALYGRLEMSPVEVRKKPKQTFCDPLNNHEIQNFKHAFIKSYWCVIAFLIVIVARPFIEANFSVFGISPSLPFGFSPEDRTLIFGQNPAISLISLITFGFSNLLKINDTLKNGISNKFLFRYFLLILFFSIIWALLIHFIGTSLSITSGIMILGILFLFLIGIVFCSLSVFLFGESITNVLLLPILRWDMIYIILKYGLGLAGLVFAGYSIKYFTDIPDNNPCLLMKAYIRQLYIAFIFFLIVLYSFNTFSSSVLTFITTKVMRYLVPPTLLGLSSYLIFITNYFVTMAPKLVVQ
jgi:hypothetical protein